MYLFKKTKKLRKQNILPVGLKIDKFQKTWMPVNLKQNGRVEKLKSRMINSQTFSSSSSDDDSSEDEDVSFFASCNI